MSKIKLSPDLLEDTGGISPLGFLNRLVPNYSPSKHRTEKGFRATKAYADDRQKAPRNRRPDGRRKRKH